MWLLAGTAVAVRIAVALATRFTGEDFLITLRYAENLAGGHGIVYNPGERVLGTTTPVYTLLLALAAWTGLPAAAFGKGLNILADGLLCLVVYRWLADLGDRRAGWIAAWTCAFNPLQIQWAISGMETGLVTLGGAAAWLCYTERRTRPAYLIAAVLFLLRWDTLLLTAVLTAALVVRERRLPLREIGLAALLVSPWLVFATLYFGSPIPVTAAAKATVYGWRAGEHPLPLLSRFLAAWMGHPVGAAAALAAAAGIWRIFRDRLAGLAPAVIWLCLYFAGLLGSRVLLFPWYYLPPLPLYIALAALGLSWGVSSAGPACDRMAASRMARSLAALLALLTAAGGAAVAYLHASRAQAIEDEVRRPLGLWLRRNAGPQERVMLEPIGTIGYYSGRRILDPIGLVSPAVIPFWRRESRYPFYDIIATFAPEWCVLRPSEAERVIHGAGEGGQRWEDGYRFVATFSSPSRPDVAFRVYRRREPSPGPPRGPR